MPILLFLATLYYLRKARVQFIQKSYLSYITFLTQHNLKMSLPQIGLYRVISVQTNLIGLEFFCSLHKFHTNFFSKLEQNFVFTYFLIVSGTRTENVLQSGASNSVSSVEFLNRNEQGRNSHLSLNRNRIGKNQLSLACVR